jgi:Flp pilus assembly protein TadD
MSLINQMLRDLEQRELSEKAIYPLIQQSVQATKIRSPSINRQTLLLIALLIAATIWFYHYSNVKVHKSTPIALSEPPLPKAKSTPINTFSKKIQLRDIPPLPEPTPIAKKVTLKTITLKQHKSQRPLPSQSSRHQQTNTKQALIKKAPRPTPEQQAEKLFKQAQQTVELSTVQATLEKALAVSPQHIDARVLLAKTYLTQGRLKKTAELLDHGLQIFPSKLRLINARAQLYLQQKNTSAALQTLQRLDSGKIANETYLSLLAASYQQQQSYSKAVEIYQKLTHLNPDQAKFWLGLGISLDNLGKNRPAFYAYQQALSRKGLSDSVVNYIKQRVNQSQIH